MVKIYRKKPVCVEAIQFTGTKENCKEIKAYVENNWPGADVEDPDYYDEEYKCLSLQIETPDNDWELDIGDWLVKGVDGSLYPVKKETFEMVYEEAGDSVDESYKISW